MTEINHRRGFAQGFSSYEQADSARKAEHDFKLKQDEIDRETAQKDFEWSINKRHDKEHIAELNKFSAAGEIDEEYLTPMEDIFEEIESIVSRPLFGLSFNYIEGKYVLTCQNCSKFKVFGAAEDRFKQGKDFQHENTCDIFSLKDLIATLGDMIS